MSAGNSSFNTSNGSIVLSQGSGTAVGTVRNDFVSRDKIVNHVYPGPVITQAEVFLVSSLPNPNFVDRPDVFRELRHAIEKSKGRIGNNYVTLCGLGGTGKTEIALEYCYRNRETYKYIFWIDADTENAVQSSFVDAARMLGLPALATLTSANPESVVPCFIQWLQSNSGWLLVFDNADDYSLGNPSDHFHLQRRYFPKTSDGVILITTRNDSNGQDALGINLDDMKMDDEVALRLLLRKDAAIVNTDPMAIEVVRELGHLPLAIDLAGACMAIERLSPDKFLTKYREDQASYLNLEDIQRKTGNPYGKTVWSVWSVSFDRINKNDPLAASLLRTFALLYSDDIPFALFERHTQRILGLPETPLGRSLTVAVNHLRDFSLIRRTFRDNVDEDNPAKDTLSIHRLVQKVILLQIELPEKLLMCERLISALSCEVPSEFRLYDEHFRRIMEVYIPHVQHIVGQYTRWAIGQSTLSNELTSLLLPTVAYLVQQGLFEGVESLAKLAVKSSKTTRGEDHADTATALSNLSYLYTSQRNFEAAESHCIKALEIRQKMLGKSHKDTIALLKTLGYVYQELGMEEKAALFYLDAANSDDYAAQMEMARRYQEGIGVPANGDTAVYWLCRSEESVSSNHNHISNRIDYTPLHHAIQHNQIASIRTFVTYYEQFSNVGDKNGQNPLHLSASNGNIKIVRMLLTKLGADANAKDLKDWTPLHYAAENGRLEVVWLLLAKFEADANAKAKDGWTPLHSAATNGFIEVANLLGSKFNSDVNAKSECGRTPLHEAATNGHIDLIMLLAHLGADANAETSNGWTPLHEAAMNGHLKVARLLVDLDADVNIRTTLGRTPLHLAAENGQTDVVKLLVTELGADVNVKTFDNQMLLHNPVQGGCAKLVRPLMIEFGEKVNTKCKGWTPLHGAVERGHIKAVRLLGAELEADVNAKDEDGRTPLHLAVQRGHIDIVMLLAVELEADVNAKDEDGRTPLHLALESGHFDVVRLFATEFGADVNAKTNDGWTPLHMAVQGGHIGIVLLLAVELKADVDAKNNYGWTPLHLAVQRGHIGIVKLLAVELKADINAKSNNGWTPLHLAVQRGHIGIVILLAVELKADINAKTNDGEMPLHLAVQGQHKVVESFDGIISLGWAASRGQIEVVRLLAAKFWVDADANDPNGQAALHLAIQGGHVDTVRLFAAELGVDVNAKTDDGRTSLYLAVEGRHVDIVKLLTAEFGTDINSKNVDGRTPLHLAAEIGDVEFVRLLMDEFGADVNAKSNDGWTPLQLAVQKRKWTVVRLLNAEFMIDDKISDSIIPQYPEISELIAFFESRRFAPMERELDPGSIARFDMARKGLDPAIIDWVSEAHVEIVRLLIAELGADVNAKDNLGRTPLYWAAQKGQVEVVRMLVKLREDISISNGDSRTLLPTAAVGRHGSVVRLPANELEADVKIRILWISERFMLCIIMLVLLTSVWLEIYTY